MSNSKQYSVYDVISKNSNITLESDVPTRREARDIKRDHGNARIEQRTYALVSVKAVR